MMVIVRADRKLYVEMPYCNMLKHLLPTKIIFLFVFSKYCHYVQPIP